MKADYDIDAFHRAVRQLGVDSGDIVYAPAALFGLGQLEGAASAATTAAAIYSALLRLLGASGTLSVPAAFEDYARHGHVYDCRRSPVDRAQGALSAHLVAQPAAWRSYCPMNGVAAVGLHARGICHQRTGSATGTLSPWHMLHELDAKFLFIGLRPNQALNFIYYAQQRFGVPHLYTKLYQTPIFDDGEAVDFPVTAQVRYLDPRFRIVEDALKFETLLTEKGMIKKAPLGRGHLFLIESAKAVFDVATEVLSHDLYFFLNEKPGFVPGVIPMDGPTGPMLTDSARFGLAASNREQRD